MINYPRFWMITDSRMLLMLLVTDHDLERDVFLDRVERSDVLASRLLEMLRKPHRVVSDQFRTITRPADGDIEGALRRQVWVVCLHRGDHVVHRAPLKCVSG